ncbi:MAG: chemotaxis protein CheA [Myxococcales bacterium]|nr:chemotaxis protein CheA [Myxococcales bacterium]
MSFESSELRAELLGIFFEESAEGVDILERGLLSLADGDHDENLINDIFRAAHSIKGGAATFQLEVITRLTHAMETLLDQVRSGERSTSSELVEALLEGVDCLRAEVSALRNEGETDPARTETVQERLDGMANTGNAAAPHLAASPAATKNEPDCERLWQISFTPHPQLLQSGNDVVRMFRELAEMGELSSSANTRKLPSLSEIDPLQCYLSWELKLQTTVGAEEIAEVFAWVEDECNLEITALDARAFKLHASETEIAASPAPSQPEASVSTKNSESSASVRVSVDKIDALMNMVGELVITQAMLRQVGENFNIERLGQLEDGLAQLARNTAELQESAMRIRSMPIRVVFNRFPRLVHDISRKLGKKVELTITGESTELDKTVLEKLSDPLVHLVRNALDHGIETAEDRVAGGKPESGHLTLKAYHLSGSVVVEIIDDGRGLDRKKILQKAQVLGLPCSDDMTDEQVYGFLFQPGFSTADKVSELSGRGVGMDVVHRNITDLGGSVRMESESGCGTRVSIRLPLTLAIMDGQLLRVGNQTLIVPLVAIVESLQVAWSKTHNLVGQGPIYRLRNEEIAILDPARAMGIVRQQAGDTENALIMVVEAGERRAGILVDELLGQQQVVVKSLEENYGTVDGIAGATILGDGTVALIVDVVGLMALARKRLPTRNRSEKTSESVHLFPAGA